MYMAEYEIVLEGGPPSELIIRIIHGGVEIGSWPFKPKCEVSTNGRSHEISVSSCGNHTQMRLLEQRAQR